jgi:hypothetical protein
MAVGTSHRKGTGHLFLSLGLALTLSMNARPTQNNEAREHNAKASIKLAGVIAIPGNPLVTSDIVWVDPGTKKFYFADRSNFGIDVIDAENNLFVGRIPGFAGPQTSRGDPNANATTPPPNGEGPSGVLVTPEKKLWAGDGNSTVRVADVDPASFNYLQIIQSVSTAMPECGPRCDRADELGYDATDHIILVANNQPLTPVEPSTPSDPYATFISADTYQVLGHVVFKSATGLEQPLWDPELRRFFITVPGYRNNGGSNNGFAEIAVIDPKAMKVERTLKPGNCHASGEVLGPSQHLLVTCGGPMVMNAADGRIISRITEIGGGDEDWYNPGDGRFYFTSADKGTPPVDSLGVVDAQTGAWLQNVPDPGGRQAAALPNNNHIFTLVRVTAAMIKDPSTDHTTCSLFGFKGRGCVAVFVHSNESTEQKKSRK